MSEDVQIDCQDEANEQVKLDETKRTYCGQRYANECMLGFFYLSNFSPLKGGIFMETTNCAIGVSLLLVTDSFGFLPLLRLRESLNYRAKQKVEENSKASFSENPAYTKK